jgi:hypothetical protein
MRLMSMRPSAWPRPTTHRRSAAGQPCQPRRLKLQAARFVRPALPFRAVRLASMRYAYGVSQRGDQ